jgi:DNA-binding LacI/PurR family transcriptional regulator
MMTQEEIAKQLGVTRTTVARALAGHKNISEETREKILKYIQESGYTKNFIGSSLALKKKKVVYAFLVKTKNQTYNSEIKRGLLAAANELKEYNFKLEIIETSIKFPKVQAQKLKGVLENKKPAGIIISPIDRDEIEEILKGHEGKLKILALGKGLKSAQYYVMTNYLKAGQIAGNIMEKLLRKGEKLLVIDSGDDEMTSKLYLEGFLNKVEVGDVQVIGPVTIKNPLKNIAKIEKLLTTDVKGLYVNMYTAEILQELFNRGYDGLKIVTTTGNEIIKKFILEDKVDAAVLEGLYREGYIAINRIFDMIYKDLFIENREVYLVKSHIIFKENIDSY